jgi:hypothetical protein
MEPVRVDENGSIRLEALVPGAFYEPEIVGPDEIKLRRVTSRGPRKRTREEILAAIEASPLRFTKPWDEVKRETRE